MSDIALIWSGQAADFELDSNDLEGDDGLETAVLLSLFTDRRAEDDDVLPGDPSERGGWWADGVPVVEGDKFGSRLWLLRRSKATQQTLDRAVEYAREALQWMLDDKVAASVTVTSDTLINTSGRVIGWAVLPIITRPNGSTVQYRYDYTWAAQEAA